MGQWSIQDSRSCSGPGPVSNDVINDGKAEGEPWDSQPSNTAEDEDDAKASEGDVEFKRVGVA